MDEHIAIRVKGLSKRYTIGAQKSDSLRHSLGDLFRKKKTLKKEFWALRDVNFEIQKGDVVGIVGKNGAGKSTLLKILSQITKPTEGSIEINGRIASLLEVGTGFHPELTGRENIYLNGTILGMTRKEVAAKFDEIVEFSGVEKFIDTPVKHYSSGMYVRLAFAVAAHLEPEILVVDEVLAVGDSEFQKKCLGKMQDVAGAGRTVLFVSHNMGAIANLCNKGIVLKNGELTFAGNINDAIDTYLKQDTQVTGFQLDEEHLKTKDVYFQFINTLTKENMNSNEFKTSDEIKIEVEFVNHEMPNDLLLGIAALDKNKNKLFTNHFKVSSKRESNKIQYIIPGDTFCPGMYSFDLALFVPNNKIYHFLNDVCDIHIIDAGTDMYNYEGYGSLFVKCSWNEMDI